MKNHVQPIPKLGHGVDRPNRGPSKRNEVGTPHFRRSRFDIGSD